MSAGARAIGGSRDDVLRQLWRMMELNADIDRNRSDGTFALSGGTIHYVFDENIFELFIRPYDRGDYVAAFHSRHRKHNRLDRVEDARGISTQSALICAEYLFSGRLPGQRDKRIYMTEWHFWELRDQVEHRRHELLARLKEAQNEKAIDAFLNNIGALSDKSLRKIDPITAEDVEDLRKRNCPEEVLRRFTIAREAARLLAADEILEPMQQLDRIFSDEIAPRLRPLHMDFRPDEAAQQRIRGEARHWLDRLLEEQKIRARWPGAEGREDRPRASLQSDARALAYILWLVHARARQAERFVLVTGDRLLFDAYRRWHVEQPLGEPFVLRRVLQFAPFINLNDSPNDISDARELFDQTRQAVEVPLIAFNLSRPKESGEPGGAYDQHAARAREHLLLLLSGPGNLEEDLTIGYFMHRLDEDWLQSRETEYDALRSAWRRIERMSIGANYQLVAQRLDRAQRTRAELAAGGGAAEARGVFISYLRQLLDRIIQNSIKLWFPLAADFIRASQWPGHELHSQPRVPIALRLRIPMRPLGDVDAQKVRLLELDALLDGWGKGDAEAARILDVEQNPALSERQYFVFAVAATLALRMGLWSQAERYADLASSSANVVAALTITENAARDDMAECFYLKAVATRFRLGAFTPYGSPVTENVWGRWLRDAVALLDQCEAQHREQGQILRELRAVSERAALRLFYATWIAVGPPVPSLPFFPADEAFCQLEASAGDLRHCLALEVRARAAVEQDVQRQAFFKRLERQYVTNCAAAEVIAALVGRNHALSVPVGLVGQSDPLMCRILDWTQAARYEGMPTVARVDLSAFLVLRQKDQKAASYLQDLSENRSHWPTLAIDQSVLRAILGVMHGWLHDSPIATSKPDSGHELNLP